jgi:hypothetical protein
MKRPSVLDGMSLLTILFTTLSLADNIVRGIFPGGLASVPIMVIAAVWLYGTLALDGRRSRGVIILVLSLRAVAAIFSIVLATRGPWNVRYHQSR